MVAKTWKMTKGRYGYVTARGKRGIESTLKAAKKAAGTSTKSSSSKKTKTGSVKKTANRKFSIPLAPTFGLATGFVYAPPGWKPPIQGFMEGDLKGAFDSLVTNYTFFEPPTGRFSMNKGMGLKALVIGLIIHAIASKLGLNRYLGRVLAGWPIGITI